eukprot:624695-Amphidinium_carterae.1
MDRVVHRARFLKLQRIGVLWAVETAETLSAQKASHFRSYRHQVKLTFHKYIYKCSPEGETESRDPKYEIPFFF